MSTRELTVVRPGERFEAPSAEWLRSARHARMLSWLSLVIAGVAIKDCVASWRGEGCCATC
jgi:hypothetical protein